MPLPSITVTAPEALATRISDFVEGRHELTGLGLYYELERVSSLLEFHTMLRTGARNRTSSGLQQSYGDHNRLLMLGLDKLVEGDVDWYRDRLAGDDAVSDEALTACVKTAKALDPPREVLVAFWLAAALHDCGMLGGRGAEVDVEDGVVLGRDVIDALCPEQLRALALAVLHHHDYIKGVFLGEVPTATVADELDALPPSLQRTTLAGLGLVQVAGAASLGEGRLSSFRIGIFERCLAGTALADRGVLVRLARLLRTGERATPPPLRDASALLDRLDAPRRELLETMLTRASVHAWQRATKSACLEDRMVLLTALAGRWSVSQADHVVLRGERDLTASLLASARARVETALSGARLLVFDW